MDKFDIFVEILLIGLLVFLGLFQYFSAVKQHIERTKRREKRRREYEQQDVWKRIEKNTF